MSTKRFLFLFIILPCIVFGQKNLIIPGEYDNYGKGFDGHLYNIVTAGNTGKPLMVAGDPGIVDGNASLHTAAFVGKDSFEYVIGDNSCNITGLGLKGATIGLTKTGIPNVKQVIAYANSGNGPTLPNQQGLGYGTAALTYSGAIVLTGNTQSGFRGDGTEGNVSESAPYVVTSIPKAVSKIAIGSFCYALCADGTVYSWGGTRLQYYPTYVLGRGVDNPDPTRPGLMAFPEPIVDLQGGGNWTLFKGKSGQLYGVAYNTRYLGLGPNIPGSNKPFLLKIGLPDVPVQLAVGPQASYALMPNGDAYAWGDNTQAAIGNGAEAAFSNFVAPWGGGALWVDKPVKINPAGVSFVKLFTSIGDAFYVYAEDTSGNLWVWGRNKGFVLWNGQGGDPTTQSNNPNKWDVLAPTKISGFGAVVPPVIAPRSVKTVSLKLSDGTIVPLPLAALSITYDGN